MASRAQLPQAQESDRQVRPLQLPSSTPEAFGAARGRALQHVGQRISDLGDVFAKIGEDERTRKQSADVMHAYNDASGQMREHIYNPQTGIMAQTGAKAWEAAGGLKVFQDEIYAGAMKALPSDDARMAFDRMWIQHMDGVENSVAAHVSSQASQYRQDQTKALLQGSAIAAADQYGSEKAITAAIDNGKTVILANAAGASPESVQVQMREYESGVHTAVVSRMAIDDPIAAQKYYEDHASSIVGADHIKIDDALRTPLRRANIASIVSTVTGGSAPANALVGAVIGVESSGDPTAVSGKGASGLMQVMPATAGDIAKEIGDAGFPFLGTEQEQQDYLRDPQKNVFYGTFYLQKQLDRYNGDVEAALVAYNAGAGTADKWLAAGRDDSVIPAETRSYVDKVTTRWRGDNGVQVQGGREARLALKPFLASGKGAEHLDGMSDVLAVRLAQMFEAMPLGIRAGTEIFSGYRSPERQAELFAAAVAKYGSEAEARKWVAPPGRSQHNHGRAADLHFGSTAADQWIHENAKRFGLIFPLSNENWHIETIGARGGQPGPTIERQQLMAGQQQPTGDQPLGTFSNVVSVDPGSVSAFDSMVARSPFVRVDTQEFDLETALARAQMMTDDPEVLQGVERRLNAMATVANKGRADALQQQKSQAFAMIWNHGRVEDIPVQVLSTLGPEFTNQLVALEENRRTGYDRTDEATYYQLSQMPDEELAAQDLMMFATKLSEADMKKFADMQRTIMNKAQPGQIAGMRSASDITSEAVNIMGLDPNNRPDDARQAGAFRARVDQEITRFAELNKRPPNAIEIQAVVDNLLIENQGSGDAKYLFQATPEQLGTFEAADELSDIPQQNMQLLSGRFQERIGRLPTEEEAVGYYNDAIRAKSGIIVPLPDADKADFTAGLARALGRSVTDDEANRYYTEWLSQFLDPGSTAAPGTSTPPVSSAPPTQIETVPPNAPIGGGTSAYPQGPPPPIGGGIEPYPEGGQTAPEPDRGIPAFPGGETLDPARDVPSSMSLGEVDWGALKYGARNDDNVKAVQELLNGMGITSDNGEDLKIDGTYGPRTREALARYAIAQMSSGGTPAAPAAPDLMHDVPPEEAERRKVRGLLADALDARDRAEEGSEEEKRLQGRVDDLMRQVRKLEGQ